MTGPSDPLAAVTHPDPYPYYADLVARRPLVRDEALGVWVASSAEAVGAVLTSGTCRVRPAAEPVPRALLGSPAGEIFGRLVRMNDGPRHAELKPALASVHEAVDPGHAAALARTCADVIVDELAPADDPGRIADVAFRLSPYVVASLLGAPSETLPRIARWTDELVRGLAPGAGSGDVERGGVAAGHLGTTMETLVEGEGVAAALARHARDPERQVFVANAVGVLSQAYEATAGLIGNTLRVLARDPDVRRAISAATARLPGVVTEVARHDPPVQNTRRFVVEDGVVAGRAMREGDAILVVLAAANRDPAANPQPARFDADRAAPRTFTFGLGAHACPGGRLATTIATAGVARLLAKGLAVERLADGVTYRPSVNRRVPLFGPRRR